MTDWNQFCEQAPELAGAVEARFAAHRHHVLATLRADGSPRVSGTEVAWHPPNLTLGSMAGAMKARDLRRDGRMALHANPGDGSMVGGDAKLSGRAIEIVDPAELRSITGAGDAHFFLIDLTEVVLTRVSDDQTHLVISLWRPGQGVTEIPRH